MNPKDRAAQEEKRVDFSLIPVRGLIEEALAFLEGHYKYGGHNFVISQISASTYLNAILRHTYKIMCGEDRDPETGVHHAGSIRACANVYISAQADGYFIDDRPPRPKNTKDMFETHKVGADWLCEQFGPGPGKWTELRRRELVKTIYKLREEKKKAGLTTEEETYVRPREREDGNVSSPEHPGTDGTSRDVHIPGTIPSSSPSTHDSQVSEVQGTNQG